MEFEPLFGELDFSRYQDVQFQDKLGYLFPIYRVIYNGRKYTYGGSSGGSGGGSSAPSDGAVAISPDFAVWRFVAPPNRWDLSRFTEMTLKETMSEIVEDTKNAPVPAFEEFFAYLGDPVAEQYANMAIHGGYSSIRIAYREADLPLIQGCSTFSQFMEWLGKNCGESGNLIAGKFINEQNLIIPIDQYRATPVRFTLRATPKERPNFYEETVVASKGETVCIYGKMDGHFTDAVFYIPTGSTTVLYSFTSTADKNGLAVPMGWSVYNGTAYTATQAPVGTVVEYDASVQYTYLTKIFFDIEYEPAEASVYLLNNSIDMSSIPAGFSAESYGFSMQVIQTETQQILCLALGRNEDNISLYYYFAQDETIEGETFSAGWNMLDSEDGSVVPVNMENRELQLHLVSGEYEVSDMEALASIATYQKTEATTKEFLDGTVYIVLRA